VIELSDSLLDALLDHVFHEAAKHPLSDILLIWHSRKTLDLSIVYLKSSLQDSGPISILLELDVVNELSPGVDLSSDN
jgi:hypothetical protein